MSDSRTAMVNRLETEVDPDMKALLKEQIKRINKLIAKAERLCLETVRKNDSTNKLCERFTQVGGVGAITAISILAGLPEIGTLSDEKLNRLVGISPEEDQSGSRDRLRRIWGGRQDVRNALYMAATASLMWNSILGAYYRKKRAEGHPHKWAMVPTMRKLLSLLNRRPGLHAKARTGIHETQRHCDKKEKSCVTEHARGWFLFPSSFSPLPSSSLLSFPLRWSARGGEPCS